MVAAEFLVDVYKDESFFVSGAQLISAQSISPAVIPSGLPSLLGHAGSSPLAQPILAHILRSTERARR